MLKERRIGAAARLTAAFEDWVGSPGVVVEVEGGSLGTLQRGKWIFELQFESMMDAYEAYKENKDVQGRESICYATFLEWCEALKARSRWHGVCQCRTCFKSVGDIPRKGP